MPLAIYPSVLFTVVLLFATAYFVMGGLPLLILSHDTPRDARFVGRFFDVYYACTFWPATGASISYALWGHATPATSAAAVAISAMLLKRRLGPVMAQVARQIEANQPNAIARYRKLNSATLAVNVVQVGKFSPEQNRPLGASPAGQPASSRVPRPGLRPRLRGPMRRPSMASTWWRKRSLPRASLPFVAWRMRAIASGGSVAAKRSR